MSHSLHWQKSSFSDGGEGNTCVEIAASPGALHLRESDAPDVEVSTSSGPLAQLIRGVKAGATPTPA
ncbi:DUF397 domain-containing protein [Streptomyces tauricus]|uniref:DUF397 domain-containing protein n=1 Tax=Streptomyces tauricus TaxID=68274 RepID=UPI00387EF42A